MINLIEKVLSGDKRSAARIMRMLDDKHPQSDEILAKLYPHTGKSRIIGITGSPGAGKSTLIDGLIQVMRQEGMKVGVVAIDPSSPFTGGAILGDRLRMQRHSQDDGVFIRSLASRGRLGGLSASTGKVVMVLDAMGFDRIIIETVGVGQDEVDVVKIADVTVVVLSPGQGDEVQAHKAGILEIADVLVVNKADLPNAERTVQDLLIALDMAPQNAHRPQIIRTVALKGGGVKELFEEVEKLLEIGDMTYRIEKAKERAYMQVFDLVIEALESEVRTILKNHPFFIEQLEKLYKREIDPLSIALRCVEEIKRKGD